MPGSDKLLARDKAPDRVIDLRSGWSALDSPALRTAPAARD
jgi:hypothetical protein